MPVLTTLYVKPTELRRGDTITAESLPRGRGAVTVTQATRQQVNTTVTYHDAQGDEHYLQVRNDSTLTVLRNVKTDEEKAADRLDFHTRTVVDLLERSLRDPAADLTAYIDKARAGDYQELADWGQVDGFIHNQAKWKIARLVEHLRDQILVKEVGDGEGVIVTQAQRDRATADAWATWYAQKVFVERDRYPRDPGSRSTAALSNYFEDVDVWAEARVMRDLRDYADHALLRQRAQEIFDTWEANKKNR